MKREKIIENSIEIKISQDIVDYNYIKKIENDKIEKVILKRLSNGDKIGNVVKKKKFDLSDFR